VQIAASGLAGRRRGKEDMEEETQEVGAEDRADVTARGGGWQRKGSGFGCEIEPLGQGAEEKLKEGNAGW
jgi:hypothetical protein